MMHIAKICIILRRKAAKTLTARHCAHHSLLPFPSLKLTFFYSRLHMALQPFPHSEALKIVAAAVFCHTFALRLLILDE